jgi:lipopolysaccharide assembly outer membrane protein LptD (OstA)
VVVSSQHHPLTDVPMYLPYPDFPIDNVGSGFYYSSTVYGSVPEVDVPAYPLICSNYDVILILHFYTNRNPRLSGRVSLSNRRLCICIQNRYLHYQNDRSQFIDEIVRFIL